MGRLRERGAHAACVRARARAGVAPRSRPVRPTACPTSTLVSERLCGLSTAAKRPPHETGRRPVPTAFSLSLGQAVFFAWRHAVALFVTRARPPAPRAFLLLALCPTDTPAWVGVAHLCASPRASGMRETFWRGRRAKKNGRSALVLSFSARASTSPPPPPLFSLSSRAAGISLSLSLSLSLSRRPRGKPLLEMPHTTLSLISIARHPARARAPTPTLTPLPPPPPWPPRPRARAQSKGGPSPPPPSAAPRGRT